MRRFLQLNSYFMKAMIARRAFRPFGLRSFRAITVPAILSVVGHLCLSVSVITISFAIIMATLVGLNEYLSQYVSDPLILSSSAKVISYFQYYLKVYCYGLMAWISIVCINHADTLANTFNDAGMITLYDFVVGAFAFVYASAYIPTYWFIHTIYEIPFIGIAATWDMLMNSLVYKELSVFPWNVWTVIKSPFGHAVEFFTPDILWRWLPDGFLNGIANSVAASVASLVIIRIIKYYFGL